MTDKEWETARAKAYVFGQECGTNSGSWVLDGNSSLETAQRILDGWEDGDPEILDMQPSPLSGEWADGITASEVYTAAEMAEDESDDGASEILDAFEDGFTDGYWLEVCRSARAMGATRPGEVMP